MIKNYIRKNSRVEAVLWDGQNFEELQAFTAKKVQPVPGNPEVLILMDEDNYPISIIHIGVYLVKDNEGKFDFVHKGLFNRIYEASE